MRHLGKKKINILQKLLDGFEKVSFSSIVRVNQTTKGIKKMTEAQITRYTVDERNGERNGCLVASKIDGKVRVGYSKCHRADEFDKHLARRMATGRMNNLDTDYSQEIPASMYKEFVRFTKRCNKYFKS